MTSVSREAVLAHVQGVIEEALGRPRSSVAAEDRLFELGASSFSMLEILGSLEERFGVRLPPGEVYEIADTVGQLADVVYRRASAPGLVGSPAPIAARDWSPTSPSEPGDDVAAVMADAWREALGMAEPAPTDDFFDLGGSSVQLAALTRHVERRLGVRLTVRQCFEVPTLAAMTASVAARVQRGITMPEGLVARFDDLAADATFSPPGSAPTGSPRPDPEVVLLTGATGFVGSYLLAELLRTTSAEVRCLVRCRDPVDGRARVIGRLRALGSWDPELEARIRVVPGALDAPDLGLAPSIADALAEEVDLVLHNGALVNFLYPYRLLVGTNVEGTRRLLNLAWTRRLKAFVHVSSIAALPMGSARHHLEDAALPATAALNTAYCETKWVAERLVAESARAGLPTVVLRLGEVCGHSETGECGEGYFISALVAACTQLGMAPALSGHLELTPVDYVARAAAWLALHPGDRGGVYHLVNPAPMPLERFFEWLEASGYVMERLPWSSWKERLLAHPLLPRTPLRPFVPLMGDLGEENLSFARYDCARASAALAGSGIRCPPVDNVLLHVCHEYFMTRGSLCLRDPEPVGGTAVVPAPRPA